MLLAIDIGNTNVVAAVFEEERNGESAQIQGELPTSITLF